MTIKIFTAFILAASVVFSTSLIYCYQIEAAGALLLNQTNQTNQSPSELNKKGLEFLNSGNYNESLVFF